MYMYIYVYIYVYIYTHYFLEKKPAKTKKIKSKEM